MKGEEYRDKRVYALLQRAETAINTRKCTVSYRVAWFSVHGMCKPYASLNDVKREIQENWIQASDTVVREETKKAFQAILDSLVPTFENDCYQFPDPIVEMIEAEMQAMQQLKRRPNYISVRAGNGGVHYQIVRATLTIDRHGKKRLGNSSVELYSVYSPFTAEKITDALTACAYAHFGE